MKQRSNLLDQELERIILFKERYPEVNLVYGHDLKTH
jgi:hypothetical protein